MLIEQRAYETLINLGIRELPITLPTLVLACRNKDWRIASYKEGAHEIASLGLQEITEAKDGISYLTEDGDVWIFYRDELPLSSKIFVIAHEIGHVYLSNHTH